MRNIEMVKVRIIDSFDCGALVDIRQLINCRRSQMAIKAQRTAACQRRTSYVKLWCHNMNW
jgi:hypothetical protein